MLAGFWEKAGAWALPGDSRGQGYGHLLRERRAEIGFCTLFIFASGWGQTFLLSIFQPHWREAIGLSTGGMGTLYGTATLASGLLLPAVGRWLDRTSTSRAAAAAVGGLTLAAILAASAVNLWTLGLALFTLRFFGQGLSANVGITRAARWFDHNRGKAVSLSGLGFPIGEAILPIAVTASIGVLGWRPTWLVLAAVSALVLAPIAFRLLAQRRSQAPTPGGAGALPRPAHHDRGSLLHDWRLYAMLTVSVPVPFIGTGLIFFQSTIAEIRGWSPTVYPTGFMVFAATRALFSIFAGAWVDRLGSLRLLAAPTTLFALGLVFLAQPPTFFAYVFFALLGVGFGAASGVMTTAWADLFGTARIGLIKGISSSVAVISTALAPVVFGWLFEAGVALETLLWSCAALILALAWPLCLLLYRRGSRVG